MLGLKRETVLLCEHSKEWETEAEKTIKTLKNTLGNIIKDIQHIGSTSIYSIKAKPIIDIVVAVDNFDDVLDSEVKMRENSFFYRPSNDIVNQLLFASGSMYDGTGDLQTHFIHIVKTGSMEHINYINFRDYLNSNPEIAKEYEDLKVSLAKKYSHDNGRENYLKGKHDFIVYTLRKALVKSYIGKTVNIEIDRPIGYIHHKEKYSLIYPINYGYIPKILGGDGEELDVYLLGVTEPVKEYYAEIIGIVHRENDVEDKLIAAPVGMKFGLEQIKQAIDFQEQYYKTQIETADNFLISDIKGNVNNSVISELLAPSVYNPTKERLLNRAKKYSEGENIYIYSFNQNDFYRGIVVFKLENNSAQILDIAIKPEYQKKGIGTKLLDFIVNEFEIDKIIAETDDDAVSFYRKYGFSVSEAETEYDTKRYQCIYSVV